MSGFVEKTVAEQGFASSWDLHVDADLVAAVKQRQRRMLFASLATGISVGLGMVALFLKGIVPEDSIFAQPLYVALVVALAALAAIASWVTLLHPGAELAERVWDAVEGHFAALFSRDDNDAFAEVIIQDLAADGVLDAGSHEITSHQAGSYRGCRIRLFAARVTKVTGSRRAATQSDLVVARVSLPGPVAGEISIDTDRSRLPEGQSFHVDHDQFDHIFGISCTDRMAAKSLLTSQMAESLLLVQQRIANPLNKASLNGVRVAMQVADGSLVLLVEEQAAKAGTTRHGAAALENLARSLVMRFATVPGIVDELHGDGVNPAAFAPLPVS
ncbi:MAG: DUF3137 domain-containing protein, partial [Rhodobiaceae bacterium]